MHIAPEIFKAYDIRGIVDQTLTADAVYAIGRALGSEARRRQQHTIVVGRDGRLSGERLAEALCDGLLSTGLDVVDIGQAPTPVVYYAAQALHADSCVAVTGSHNPPEYNGLKMVLGGQTLFGEHIQSLRKRILAADFEATDAMPGKLKRQDLAASYIQRIAGDVRLARRMKIAVDCGNGVAGAIAARLFRALGCQVEELFCEVDGNFPNHHPDPSKPENLADLRQALARSDAEIGLAFDGDGDRLGVVTKSGEIIYPDRQLMLFAADVLLRHPGETIIYDVKCSRLVTQSIARLGGKPLMWNTGHALIKTKLKETGALLAGEMSGHIFFKERWYGFDDGLYAGARLLEIVSRWPDANWPLMHLPKSIATPELNVAMREGEPHQLIARLKATGRTHFAGALELITIDGVRVEFADGFGLARASNTTPVIVLRFEADTLAALARIQQTFKAALQAVWPGLSPELAG